MKSKKYKLLKNNQIKIDDRILYRIEALRQFSFVKKGDLGGYIEKESNLSHEDDCWVYDNARVSGNARVYYNARVCGNVCVSGNARVYDNAWVCGNVWVSGNARVYDIAWVYDSNFDGGTFIKDFDIVNGTDIFRLKNQKEQDIFKLLYEK